MGTTLTNLRTQIRRDIALDEEAWVSDAELNKYINEGIDEAEREINTLAEDYFLNEGVITRSGSTQYFTLPSDIYGDKIRGLWYDDDGTREYEIKRMRKLEDIYIMDDVETAEDNFCYMLFNDVTNGLRLKMYPTFTNDPASNIKLYYIRQAKTLSSDSDECDIPEFESFVITYAKVKCLEKDVIDPRLGIEKQNLERERHQLDQTLRNRVPDNNNTIIPDVEFYEDFDSFDRLEY